MNEDLVSRLVLLLLVESKKRDVGDLCGKGGSDMEKVGEIGGCTEVVLALDASYISRSPLRA